MVSRQPYGRLDHKALSEVNEVVYGALFQTVATVLSVFEKAS
jgi:hypothetical protein